MLHCGIQTSSPVLYLLVPFLLVLSTNVAIGKCVGASSDNTGEPGAKMCSKSTMWSPKVMCTFAWAT